MIWIRNWLGLWRISRIQALHDKQLKNYTQNKTMGYITPAMGYYPRNGSMGDIDPRSDM